MFLHFCCSISMNLMFKKTWFSITVWYCVLICMCHMYKNPCALLLNIFSDIFKYLSRSLDLPLSQIRIHKSYSVFGYYQIQKDGQNKMMAERVLVFPSLIYYHFRPCIWTWLLLYKLDGFDSVVIYILESCYKVCF